MARRTAPDVDDTAQTVVMERGAAPPDMQEAARPRRARRLASGPAIREAAAALFLEKGYQGTSMDDIAAAAHISKQTIYTHFADKEQLFSELVLGNTERVDEFVQSLVQAVRDAPDSRAALHELARSYIRIVAQPEVLRLRRLVIGESGRFPDVARAYYEQVPQRMYSALTDLLRELAERGDLQVEDPEVAAHQLAWLIVGVPMDQGMFLGADGSMTDADLDRIADAGVATFLAAHSR
jgi:TetR/AcrR family transcriptional repressor of mexJK operon